MSFKKVKKVHFFCQISGRNIPLSLFEKMLILNFCSSADSLNPLNFCEEEPENNIQTEIPLCVKGWRGVMIYVSILECFLNWTVISYLAVVNIFEKWSKYWFKCVGLTKKHILSVLCIYRCAHDGIYLFIIIKSKQGATHPMLNCTSKKNWMIFFSKQRLTSSLLPRFWTNFTE